MATWPSEFKVLKDNFKDGLTDRTVRTSMDIGPAKVRRRTFLVVENVSLSMILTNEVYQRFKQFYYDNDALIFDFTRPDTEKTVQARFSTVPDCSIQDNMWYINVSLEILP